MNEKWLDDWRENLRFHKSIGEARNSIIRYSWLYRSQHNGKLYGVSIDQDILSTSVNTDDVERSVKQDLAINFLTSVYIKSGKQEYLWDDVFRSTLKEIISEKEFEC